MSATLPSLALLLPLATFGAPRADDWPQWRGPDQTGISTETEWTSTPSGERFRVELGLGYSSPSISGGLLYVQGFDAETNQDRLVCLDAETGDEVWAHTHASKLWDNMHEGGTLTTPTVHDGRVYLLGRIGRLFCLDAETGAELWSRDLAEKDEVKCDPFGLNTSPVLVEDMVVVNVGKTMAFDPEDGEKSWETEDYGYSYGTPVPFERNGEPCLAVFNGKGLTVLDTLLGEQLLLHPWTTKFNVNCATPIVVDDAVFISTGYDDKGCALLGVGGDEIELRWENKAMRNQMSGCVLIDEHLYGFDKTMLKCIDLEGREMWRERGTGSGALAAAGDRLLILSEKGEYMVAPASPDAFEPVSRTTAFEEGVCWTPPVLAHGLVYLRNNKGRLICLDHRPKSGAAGERDGR